MNSGGNSEVKFNKPAGVSLSNKRVLILSYSYSSQTRNLLQGFVKGLEECQLEPVWYQVKTVQRLQFPAGSFVVTIFMMIMSFFRRRCSIEPLDKRCLGAWDLVVLAGPTWSYSPSGPILRLLDRDKELFRERTVLPFISCRAYWRFHHQGLKNLLKKCGSNILSPIVFSHPVAEPWSTIGVFLKMAGKVPESSKWLKKYYPKYGHTRAQVDQAKDLGRKTGELLINDSDLQQLDFPKPYVIEEE